MPPHGYKRVNADGSRNVWCPQCRQYICSASAMSGINTAICIVCQCDNDGVELTPEQVRELRGVRVGEYTLSQAAAFPEKVADPMTLASPDEIDSMTGRVGYFLKALVRVIVRASKQATTEIAVESKAIAKANKRKRMFDLPLDEE